MRSLHHFVGLSLLSPGCGSESSESSTGPGGARFDGTGGGLTNTGGEGVGVGGSAMGVGGGAMGIGGLVGAGAQDLGVGGVATGVEGDQLGAGGLMGVGSDAAGGVGTGGLEADPGGDGTGGVGTAGTAGAAGTGGTSLGIETRERLNFNTNWLYSPNDQANGRLLATSERECPTQTTR